MTEPQVMAGVAVRRDLVFSTRPGYRPLSLDLYLPDRPAGAVCLYLHGGGWRMGSRRAGPGPLSPTSARAFGRMAAHGLAVASADYRLSGEARFPAQPVDAKAACRWLLEDPASPVTGLPLVLFGVSAGGQIAALCGLDPGVQARAVALWYPVTDLLALPADIESAGGTPEPEAGSRETLLLGTPASAVPDAARQASPVAHVHAGAPPFLLVHGTADVLVPPRQSERLHEALTATGVRSTFERLEGHAHLLPGIHAADLEALVDRTTRFLLTEAARPQGPAVGPAGVTLS